MAINVFKISIVGASDLHITKFLRELSENEELNMLHDIICHAFKSKYFDIHVCCFETIYFEFCVYLQIVHRQGTKWK